MEVGKCVKCHQTFNKDRRRPKAMDCGHVICLEDLQTLIKSKPFKCPVDSKPCNKPLEEFADDHTQMDCIDQSEIRCSEHSAITDKFCMTHCRPKCPNCVHAAGCVIKTLPDDLMEAKQKMLEEIDTRFRSMPTVSPDLRAKYERKFTSNLRDNFDLLNSLVLLEPKPFITCDACPNQADVMRFKDFKAFCGKHSEKQILEGTDMLILREAEDAAVCEKIMEKFPGILAKVNFYHIKSETLGMLSNPPQVPKAIFDLAISLIRLWESKGSFEYANDEFCCPQCKRKLRKANATLTVLPCSDAYHAVCDVCVREKGSEPQTVCPLDKKLYGVPLAKLPTDSAVPVQAAPISTSSPDLPPELAAMGQPRGFIPQGGYQPQPQPGAYPAYPPAGYPPPSYPPGGYPPAGYPQQMGFSGFQPPQPVGFPAQPPMGMQGPVFTGPPAHPGFIPPELAGMGRGVPMGMPPSFGGPMPYPPQMPPQQPFAAGGFPTPPRPPAQPGMGSPKNQPQPKPGPVQQIQPKANPLPPVVKPVVQALPARVVAVTPQAPSMPSIPKIAGTALPPGTFHPPEFALDRFPSVLPPLDVAAAMRSPNQRGWSQTIGRNQVEAVVFTCSESRRLFGISIAAPVERNQASIVEFVNLYRGKDTKQPPAYSHRGRERIEGGNQIMADIKFAQPFPIAPYTPYSLKLKLSGEPATGYETYRGNPFDRPDIWFGEDGSLWEFEECTLVEPNEYLNGQNNLSGPMLRFLYRTN